MIKNEVSVKNETPEAISKPDFYQAERVNDLIPLKIRGFSLGSE
jgi:hypothetical protein